MSTKNTSAAVEVEGELATGEQVEHIMDMWRRRVKNRGLTKDEANQIIRNGGQYLPTMDKAADVLVDQVRSDMQNTIVRLVKGVNRQQTKQQALDATKRIQHVSSEVVATMPQGEGEEVELIYFKPEADVYKNGLISCAEVERQCALRGLTPDPIAQAKDNQDNPAFADDHPNGCQWQDAHGNYCYAAFGGWDGMRYVNVNRFGRGWGGDWLLAGVRKSAPAGE